MGYSCYFLFGYYNEAINTMESIISVIDGDKDYLSSQLLMYGEDDLTCPILTFVCAKLGLEEIIIEPIVLVYYTLFHAYRLIQQWDTAACYIDSFKQVCMNKKNRYRSNSFVLLSTAFICLGDTDEAFRSLEMSGVHGQISLDELISLCGVRLLVCTQMTSIEEMMDNGITVVLPYERSQCGEQDEKIIVKPLIMERTESSCLLVLRHGYDCYKTRPWLVEKSTIIDELGKWMKRLAPGDRLNY
ncbi:unnamed protein product [Didymodactylos carnosus]|uniref:Uncharacterized protein n=2 Tax=Didymodactylos carnosus TaxID=1234261 RepID=A0A8S2DQD8_9BILA|nr:unnamed protein product [Didymodactylos carnosus]CAF3793100.1 unnamed protein product [Didymodactylos carnosus]